MKFTMGIMAVPKTTATPTLVKSAKGTSTAATINPAFGSATTSGNLVVMGWTGDAYNGTPDSGWTQSTGMEQQTAHGGYLWWRISAGETSFTYTISTATKSAWVLAEFSNISASPYDTSAGQFLMESTSSYTTPSITPSSGSRLLAAMMGGSYGSDLSATVWGTWLNSFTHVDTSGTGGAGTCVVAGLGYRIVTGDGSTGYSTGATLSGSGLQFKSGLIIALKGA